MNKPKINLKTKNKFINIGILSCVLIAVLIYYFLNLTTINQKLELNFGSKDSILLILNGLLNTFLITLFAFIIGLIIGLIISLIKNIDSENVFVLILKRICDIYVSIFRGTPLVIQLLIIYFVIFVNFKGDQIYMAILTFGLNSGAYIAEILRGGIESIPSGQTEAARSLGLSYRSTMFRVIFPQVLKNSFPALGNEFISLFKETSIVGFIGGLDLVLAFRRIANGTFDYDTVYIIMGVIFFLLVYLFSVIFNLIERKISKNVKA